MTLSEGHVIDRHIAIPAFFAGVQHFDAQDNLNKVITTMVIKPLDDATCFALPPVTDLGILTTLYDCSRHHHTASHCVVKCSKDIKYA